MKYSTEQVARLFSCIKPELFGDERIAYILGRQAKWKELCEFKLPRKWADWHEEYVTFLRTNKADFEGMIDELKRGIE